MGKHKFKVFNKVNIRSGHIWVYDTIYIYII